MKTTIIFFALLLMKPSLKSQENWIDIKKFGAKGNGLIDDSKAFENAINYCAINSNAAIIVTSGKYLIDKQLVIKNKILIKGNNNSEIIIGNGIKNNFLWVYDKASGTTISNLKFNGLNNTSISELMRFDYIENIKISKNKFLGAIALNFDGVKHIIIKDNYFQGSPEKMAGLCNFSKSKIVLIYGNEFYSSGGLLFYDDCQNIKIQKNAFNRLTGYPIHFDGLVKKKISDVLIDNNKFVGSGAIAFKGGTYDQVSCFKVNRLQISNNTISKSGDMGITLAHCRDVYVHNNLISENNVSAISISNVRNAIIENNKLLNNGIRPTLEGTDPVALGAYYFFVRDAQYATDSLLLNNNQISFASKSKKYHAIGINGTNKNYIKIYFKNKNEIPDSGEYVPVLIGNTQYNQWKSSLLSKINF